MFGSLLGTAANKGVTGTRLPSCFAITVRTLADLELQFQQTVELVPGDCSGGNSGENPSFATADINRTLAVFVREVFT